MTFASRRSLTRSLTRPLTRSLSIALKWIGFACVLLASGNHSPLFSQPRIKPSWDRPEIRFEENLGQVIDIRGARRSDILFTAMSNGVRVFLRKSGISYVFHRSVTDAGRRLPELGFPADNSIFSAGVAASDALHRPDSIAGYRMDMELIGSNPEPVVERSMRTDDHANFYPADGTSGFSRVRSYRQVVYKEVYPGIDMVLRGTGDAMKCDFILAPGANVSNIRMKFVGADSVSISDSGSLLAFSPLGIIDEGAPFTFQSSRNGVSTHDSTHDSKVSSRYVIHDGVVSFDVAGYDRSRPLVIDPVRRWSTYFGGIYHDFVWGGKTSEVDREGNVLFTGIASSLDFPVSPGAFQTTGSVDAFIAKLDGNGNRLWATRYGQPAPTPPDRYIGSVGGRGIVSDASGNVYVCGASSAPGLATAGAFQTTMSFVDGYVAKFDPDGARIWSTYWGGSGHDETFSIVLDNSQNPIVVMSTKSSGLGTAGTFQPTRLTTTSSFDVVVGKFSTTGSLLWATYCGGGDDDYGMAIDCDANDDIVVTGWTKSTDFPVTAGAHQGALAGGADAFVLKLNGQGGRIWNTYYGGTGADNDVQAIFAGLGQYLNFGPGPAYCGITTDGSDNILITGMTSGGFPVTTGAHRTTFAGGRCDAFVAKFNPDGVRQWSTYVGGTNVDAGAGIAANAAGTTIITGFTESTNFPFTADAYQSNNAGSVDAFIVKLSSAGAFQWGTYYGGTGVDQGQGVTFDPFGSIVVVGQTSGSNDFPVSNGAFQTSNGTPASVGSYAWDVFVALFCDPTNPG